LDNAETPGSSIFDSDGLRLITDNLPILIAYIDKNERFRFVNQAFETRHSRPRAEINGRFVQDILPVEVYRTAGHWIAKTLAGEAASFEIDYKTDNGDYASWVRYMPHLAKNGDILGFFALIEAPPSPIDC